MMIQNLRILANKRDVSYQSLIKTFLNDRIDEEYGSARKKAK
jgi:hypothetical protein